MKVSSGNPSRVILSAQSSSDAEASLPLLYAYMGWKRSGLVGLFSGETAVEYSVSACQKIVTSSGRQLSLPTPEVARKYALRESREFRQLLTTVAEQRSVTCEIIETATDIVGGVCATATSGDVAILAQRSDTRRAGPVLLIQGGGASEDSGPRVFAGALASQLSAPFNSLPEWTAQSALDILGRIDRSNARAIIVDSTGEIWNRRDLRWLLNAARCPVVVFGSLRADPDALSD